MTFRISSWRRYHGHWELLKVQIRCSLPVLLGNWLSEWGEARYYRIIRLVRASLGLYRVVIYGNLFTLISVFLCRFILVELNYGHALTICIPVRSKQMRVGFISEFIKLLLTWELDEAQVGGIEVRRVFSIKMAGGFFFLASNNSRSISKKLIDHHQKLV